MKKIIITLSLLMLSCCTDKEATSKTESPSPAASIAANPSPTSAIPYNKTSQDPEMGAESNFKPNFIKADNLLKELEGKHNIYIFDVRGQIAYDESHIKGSLSKPIPISAPMVTDIPKNAKIITYCGCPHHLSSIAAEQLTKIGYKDVHVLDEGFWYWKDHKYPLDSNKSATSKVSEVNVSGLLLKDKQPIVNKDIYLKHMKTGQLEATRTDAKGFYKMSSHIYEYKNNDEFKFYVGDLSTPVQDFSTDKKENDNIIVSVK